MTHSVVSVNLLPNSKPWNTRRRVRPIPAFAYPRPDFYRPNLSWKSLNGQWNFLFDDEDVGLSERWFRSGLPHQVALTTDHSKEGNQNQKAEKITQQIAAQPERLQSDNAIPRDAGVRIHQKRLINVPFVFQTPASGLNDRGAHEVFWYELEFHTQDLDCSDGRRLLLRFGGVDYEAIVWVNGQYVGDHRGGHVPFDNDITDALEIDQDLHKLTIRVRDSPHDLSQPRGKQYWLPKPENIFYTPSSGIWQSVWLESLPAVRIADSSHGTVLRADNVDAGILHAKIAVVRKRVGQKYSVEVEANLDNVAIGAATKEILDTTYVDLEIDLHFPENKLHSFPPERLVNGLALWSPEQPNVYGIGITLKDEKGKTIDNVRTFVGLRSLDWTSGDSTFRLNGKPYFQALVLDQGYWPETGITPPSPEALMKDIELAKAMGFNGCRKHQKVEDPVFLYWADRLGYIVWGEMANGYKFDDEYVDRFNQEWTEAVKRDLNHPCVFVWTPVNESWGYPSLKNSVEQRNHIRSLYSLTKSLDATRPINDNCGWESCVTDLITFHDYSDAQKLTEICASTEKILEDKAGRAMFLEPIEHPKLADNGSQPTVGAPVLCTEFGGINIAPAQGSSKGEKDWGYTTADDPDDLLTRIAAMMEGIVRGGICCGFVYTQLTDIEQEVNGLYTFDRKPKLDVVKMKAIIDRSRNVYDQIVSRKK